MKILKNSILAVLSLLLCYSCNDEAFIEGQASEGIQATIPSYKFDGDTRVDISSDLQTFTWSAGDAIGLYHQDASGTGSAVFTLKSGGSSTGTFANSHFSLKGNSTYYAFYPYEYSAADSYSLDFTGQVQTENRGTSHVGAKNYMYSSFTTNSTGGGDIHFANVGSVMHMLLTVNNTARFTKLTITSDNQEFITKGTLSMEDGSLTATETSSTVTLGFGEGISLTEGETLTANLLTAPVNMSGSNLTMTLTDGDNYEYPVVIAGKDMQRGNSYKYETAVPKLDMPYVTFTAKEMQTLTMTQAVDKLEYSVKDGAWTSLGTTTVTFGGNYGSLRIRGTNNPNGTASGTGDYSTISFGKNTSVSCTGDIRTLVDYSNYKTVDTSNARFCYLFKDCTQLVSAPNLPATQLADNCYSHMFEGCISLATAPALPATQLSESCYSNMFKECISLTAAPALPATTLAESCYYSMFYDCSSLTIAPTLSATTLVADCYNSMFRGCTSLKTVPELPATTLAATSYNYMFYDCKRLIYVKMMATDISASSCLNSWLFDVAASGTFVKNPDATWDVSGSSGIPSGWTVIYYDTATGKYYQDQAKTIECDDQGNAQ